MTPGANARGGGGGAETERSFPPRALTALQGGGGARAGRLRVRPLTKASCSGGFPRSASAASEGHGGNYFALPDLIIVTLRRSRVPFAAARSGAATSATSTSSSSFRHHQPPRPPRHAHPPPSLELPFSLAGGRVNQRTTGTQPSPHSQPSPPILNEE